MRGFEGIPESRKGRQAHVLGWNGNMGECFEGRGAKGVRAVTSNGHDAKKKIGRSKLRSYLWDERRLIRGPSQGEAFEASNVCFSCLSDAMGMHNLKIGGLDGLGWCRTGHRSFRIAHVIGGDSSLCCVGDMSNSLHLTATHSQPPLIHNTTEYLLHTVLSHSSYPTSIPYKINAFLLLLSLSLLDPHFSFANRCRYRT